MHLLDSDTASFVPESGALASRWEQRPDLGRLPVGAMWCRAVPGGATHQDQHPKRDLITVARGAATVRTTSGDLTVEAGQSVLLDSEEDHVITNHSRGDPLVLLSIYRPPEPGERR